MKKVLFVTMLIVTGLWAYAQGPLGGGGCNPNDSTWSQGGGNWGGGFPWDSIAGGNGMPWDSTWTPGDSTGGNCGGSFPWDSIYGGNGNWGNSGGSWGNNGNGGNCGGNGSWGNGGFPGGNGGWNNGGFPWDSLGFPCDSLGFPIDSLLWDSLGFPGGNGSFPWDSIGFPGGNGSWGNSGGNGSGCGGNGGWGNGGFPGGNGGWNNGGFPWDSLGFPCDSLGFPFDSLLWDSLGFPGGNGSFPWDSIGFPGGNGGWNNGGFPWDSLGFPFDSLGFPFDSLLWDSLGFPGGNGGWGNPGGNPWDSLYYQLDCEAMFWYDFTALDVIFYDESYASAGSVISWSWDFGDGSTSTLQDPNHTYTSAGFYMVSLTIETDSLCSSTVDMPVFIYDGNPNGGGNGNGNPWDSLYNQPQCQAMFWYNDNGLEVTFIDESYSSAGNILSWSWDLGDGTTSTDQNPIHTYTATGQYLVTLSITTDSCSSTYDMPIFVFDNAGGGNGNGNPWDSLGNPGLNMVDFTAVINGLEVTFTNTSMLPPNVSTFTWDFGDGSTSTDVDPVHTYTVSDIYTVTLSATLMGMIESISYQVDLTNSTVTPMAADPGSTTGISEFILVDEVNLYPNPAVDYINIDYTLERNTDLTVQILNLSGKVVYSQIENSFAGDNSIRLNVNDLASGIYLVRIDNGSQNISLKFVK